MTLTSLLQVLFPTRDLSNVPPPPPLRDPPRGESACWLSLPLLRCSDDTFLSHPTCRSRALFSQHDNSPPRSFCVKRLAGWVLRSPFYALCRRQASFQASLRSFWRTDRCLTPFSCNVPPPSIQAVPFPRNVKKEFLFPLPGFSKTLTSPLKSP